MPYVKLECLNCKSPYELNEAELADHEMGGGEGKIDAVTDGQAEFDELQPGVIYKKQLTIESLCTTCSSPIQVNLFFRRQGRTDSREPSTASGATIVEERY